MAGVSNSSPLLYLAALGDLDYLPAMFGKIFIPQAVWQELVVDGSGKRGAAGVERARSSWLDVRAVVDRGAVAKLTHLDAGESEAIVLAQELRERTVFMDDERAVREGRSRNLLVIRTPGIYRAAKRYGWIDSIQPKLDALRANGFRLKDAHYQMILQDAGEL